MFKFSRKVEYALIAMVYMSSKPEGDLTTARELADNFKISVELLGKIMQTLVRKQLIVSIQGVKGGYFLQRRADSISLHEIMVAIEGPIQLVRCTSSADESYCERQHFCIIRNSMQNIQQKIAEFFQSMSLQDFQEKSALIR